MTSQNSSEPVSMQGPVCPVPHYPTDTIVMGHGSGGQMTHDLIQNIFQSQLGNVYLAEGNDSARITLQQLQGQLAVSTDSHVISPLFFPGGDIGRVAVCGTVNDIVTSGAQPAFLTAGFIIEEGFSMASLQKIVRSIAETCQEAEVKIVAGDTKVVDKGSADGIFINTAGFGIIPQNLRLGGQYAQPGDAVLISGTLGDHGIAVLQARGELGFDSQIQSDVAPLNHMIHDLLDKVQDVHVLRDPSRGGLATSLKEIACQSQIGIDLFEEDIPINQEVRIACEMLGFDPLYLANEGKMIIILPANQADNALELIKKHPYGASAMRIGSVSYEHHTQVLLHTAYGSSRILDMLAGEILPRIC